MTHPKSARRYRVALLLLLPMLVQCQTDRSAITEFRQVDTLRLNEVQFLGSHNSYKRAMDDAVMAQLRADNPAAARSLDYAHAPLSRQLALGLRKLELDIFHDPDGGRYAEPLGASLPGATAYDPEGKMMIPGFKTLHVQDIDFRSHCLLFRDCLASLDDWSRENPEHFPLIVTINAKDGVVDLPGFVRPLPFDDTAWDALDAEIRRVLGDRLLVPDDIRGHRETLRAAVQSGWPAIDELRGRILFVLDDSAAKKQAYAAGHPSLEGRVMFIDAPEDTPEASIRIVNDPVADEDYIRDLVEAGFIVRTRADADTREARDGDDSRFEAALRSGAQIISTDYYEPARQFGTDFQVVLPGGGVARCNPALIERECNLPAVSGRTR